jgi:hypothetical protein
MTRQTGRAAPRSAGFAIRSARRVGDHMGTAPGFIASERPQYWIRALRRQVSTWPGPGLLPTSRGRTVAVLVTGLGVRSKSTASPAPPGSCGLLKSSGRASAESAGGARQGQAPRVEACCQLPHVYLWYVLQPVTRRLRPSCRRPPTGSAHVAEAASLARRRPVATLSPAELGPCVGVDGVAGFGKSPFGRAGSACSGSGCSEASPWTAPPAPRRPCSPSGGPRPCWPCWPCAGTSAVPASDCSRYSGPRATMPAPPRAP